MTTIFELAAKLQAAGAIETMLLVVLKATLILAIARVMLMAMPRASAATRHLVATATLVAVAAMPVMTVLVPAWNIVVEKKVAAPATPDATPSLSATPSAKSGSKADKTIGATDAEDGSSIGTAISLARATGVVPDEPLSAMQRAMNVAGATWKGVIAIALGFVTLLLFAQMLLGMIGVWHVAKNAEELATDTALVELDAARDALQLDRDVRLLRSGRISVPVLWGFFKPILLLPADVVTWPAERLRVVLLHELAHLKRFDGISLIATRIAVSIFWYHPLAWSLERAGRSECERACDDLVLAGGTRPSDYADHLLAIARSMPTFDPFRSVTLAMSRKSQLEGRLLSILQPHVARRVFSGRGVAVACALAVAVIIPVSALRLTAENPKKEEVAKKSLERTNSDVTVTAEVDDDVEAIGDFLLAKLGKYDKRADKFLRTPKDGEDWYERAYDLYRNDRYEEAAVAFRKAADDGYAPAKSLYNAACSYALLGDARHAVSTLDEAINKGWDDFEHIADDSDFDPIRSDAAFIRLVSQGGAEVASRRVNETMERYNDLKQGIKEGVTQGVVQGMTEGMREGMHEGIREAMKEMFDNDDDDWSEVGLDLLRLRKFDESINAFQNAIKNGDKPGTSMYNLACAYSLKGDARNGMHWLSEAIDNGFSSDEKLENDPDIALLRKQPGFDLLRQKAEDLEMKGCCNRDDDWDDDNDNVSWKRAVEYHRQVAQKYPDSGRAWFNLGFTALQARDTQTGIDAFNRAIALDYRVGTSQYNIACGYALQGNRDAAFQWLEKSRASGFDLRGHAEGDDDLDSLHDDPRWDSFIDSIGSERHWSREKKKRHN